MNHDQMRAFLKKHQDRHFINRHGLVMSVDGMDPSGTFCHCTFIKGPIADETHPDCTGTNGMVNAASIGTTWKPHVS